ncbi:TPA: benzaldehyde dehydrogenase [Xanthomonas vasicola pv. zeae]|uniref:Benzaldehyde dehydrogenase n=1 Tax=Xanthomonas vasicola pv. vasculorum TaxID=325776 RepID=A0AAE8F7B0_XANVA|nr:benzaldehyde dehydrogenase [Xanthomonas vasicola]AVQ05562.1 benzaldehyde dehydrogenase [Xanthomonas vasicola pv. vasculorum]AZM69761.1 benzaldehyde dehydrogenase [Xanthomonas vasicola pv. vasculorum]KEZ98908.1 benzaldehyde dehydrogenase [Xanthomonas vasicola pv. vasculorum NCPPB 895]KFA36563.1 benzaldehyde dehydrogenase [Xanthomonas vasicola pv. vasculorum NCPPB 206]MBV7303165.1 benzaldehyde dehydrogenase [Xanthomonas vasicola pv. vasculorum]
MNALSSAADAATNAPAWHGCIFNGEWVPGHGGSLAVHEPATGALLHEVGKADLADVATAIAQAKQAQRAWAATSPRERAAVFHRAAQVMQARSAEATLLIARETGGILPKAQREVDEAVVLYQQAAGMPLQASGQMLPTSAGQLSLARRLPLGVIGVISPFNFPLVLSLRSVAPALAMGNAVVLKPDPRTPYTGGVIIAQVLEEAGLPKGLLHVLHGDAQIGQALVKSPDVPMIAFTGSTATGRRIGEIAGRHLKKVSLELGGNNALIVLDDADLDMAASAVAFGAYMYQGQICMATGRVLVQRGVAQALTQRLAEKARHLPVGDPVSGTVALGPIIDQRQLQRVIDIVSDSVAAGAVVEAGATNQGLFYAPTVLSNVRPGMRVFDEEVFGPVINITVFDTNDEAAELANQGEYGLAAGILSASVSRALALGEKLHTGLLHINDQTVADEVVNPFGGTGASGNGTSVGGPADWEQYTHWQWLTIKNEVPQYPF